MLKLVERGKMMKKEGEVTKAVEIEKKKADYVRYADKAIRSIKNDPNNHMVYTAWYDLIRDVGESDLKYAMEEMRRLRGYAQDGARKASRNVLEIVEIVKKTYLYNAPHCFDEFLIYNEWNRDADKRFYLPRRKQLLVVVNALQRLADDELDLLAISMPPGVGKTAIAIFYLCWLAGRDPDRSILGGSHNNAFLIGVYEECERIMSPDGEYLWHEVFPAVKICGTNKKDLRIDCGHPKRFQSLEFTSIGAGNAGKVRAGQLLYCDDLVDGIETALSAERLYKLWTQYTTDLRQRKMGGCKELHIATRWSVHDVIGKLEETYKDDPRALFIRMPALNENDESNFDYPRGGFSTADYHTQREIMDDASWRALYMNEPIEREGVLYHSDELQRYFELPDGDPDAIISICDTKTTGQDYCFLPVAYQYGDLYYIEDCVCDNGLEEVVEPELVAMLLKHKVQMARFESNSAGGKIAEKVQEMVRKRGGRAKITTKYTTANKETKIIIESAWVKEHCLFKDDTKIQSNKQYRTMLGFLCGYTTAGKNKHDDVPDGMAQLSQFAQSFTKKSVEVFYRPF